MALLLVTRYRQLVFMGVDPDGAVAAGLPVKALQLVQALVTSMVIVSAMAAVGVILVIGLLCAPVLPGLWRVRSLRAAMLQSSLVGLALSAVVDFRKFSQFATWAIDWCCLYVAALSAAFAAIQCSLNQ